LLKKEELYKALPSQTSLIIKFLASLLKSIIRIFSNFV